MYIFTQTVFHIGGGTSEGTLMRPLDESIKRLEVRQYFARHGWDDVHFDDPASCCKFLASEFYKGDRQVFFMERPDSMNMYIYCTSPCAGHELEIGLVGVLKRVITSTIEAGDR